METLRRLVCFLAFRLSISEFEFLEKLFHIKLSEIAELIWWSVSWKKKKRCEIKIKRVQKLNEFLHRLSFKTNQKILSVSPGSDYALIRPQGFWHLVNLHFHGPMKNLNKYLDYSAYSQVFFHTGVSSFKISVRCFHYVEVPLEFDEQCDWKV